MDINGLIAEITEKIDAMTDLPFETKAMTAFDSSCDPIPIDRFYVVLNGHTGKSELFDDENTECCQRTQIAINMNCYASLDCETTGLYALAQKLTENLMVHFDGKMTGFQIGSVTVEDSLRVFCLACRLFFYCEKCPAAVSGDNVIRPFADFLCKTHVNDGNVHLTENEKLYLDAPYVTGTYTGLGDGNNQSISLGFHPKIVIVFAPSTAVLAMNTEKPLLYFGVAVRSHATKGITVQKDGFKVYQSETYASGGVYPKLNELDMNYAYIAFK